MRPQAIGYGLLIEEVVKVAIALTVIVGFGAAFPWCNFGFGGFGVCSSGILPVAFKGRV